MIVTRVINTRQGYSFRLCFIYSPFGDQNSPSSWTSEISFRRESRCWFSLLQNDVYKNHLSELHGNILLPRTLRISPIKCLNLWAPNLASSSMTATYRQIFVTRRLDSRKEMVSCLPPSLHLFSIFYSISLPEYTGERLGSLCCDLTIRFILFHFSNHPLYYGFSVRFCRRKWLLRGHYSGTP